MNDKDDLPQNDIPKMTEAIKRFELNRPTEKLRVIVDDGPLLIDETFEPEPVFFNEYNYAKPTEDCHCPLCERGFQAKKIPYQLRDESWSMGIEPTEKECIECGRTFVGTLFTCSQRCTKVFIDKAVQTFQKNQLKTEVERIEREKAVARKKFLQHRPLGGLS